MSEDRPTYPVNDPLAHGTPPPTPAEIADRLRALSIEMMRLGTDMQYFGGFSPIAKIGTAMHVGASNLRTWAHEIEGAQG